MVKKMRLTTWNNSPYGRIFELNAMIAKKYLDEK